MITQEQAVKLRALINKVARANADAALANNVARKKISYHIETIEELHKYIDSLKEPERES